MKRIFKHFVFAVGFFAFSASVWANDIIINLNDGSCKGASLASVRNITFSDAMVVLNLSDGNVLSLPIAEVQRIFLGGSAGVDNLDEDAFVVVEADNLVVEGASGLVRVRVFSSSAQTLINTTLDSPGSISIAHLAPGVYVAQVETKTFKFLKR